MFISHEGVAVNLDRVDYITVRHNPVTKEYEIALQLADERMSITGSEPMTEEEAKVVYGTILAAMNGAYFDSKKKEFIYRPEKVVNVIEINKEEVDFIIKTYHEENEEKENGSQ